MVADALATCVARSSATIVLTTQDTQVLAIHKKVFQLPVPYQYWEMIWNADILFMFPEINSAWKQLSFSNVLDPANTEFLLKS